MIRINLLPVRAEKKREAFRQQMIVAAGVVLLLGAGIALVHMTLGSEIETAEQDIAKRRAEISRLQAVIGEVRQYKEKKRELEEKIDVISKLEQRQRGPVRVLDALARVVPDKLWIEKLKDTAGSLSIEGIAIDNQTIAQFMTRMEASPWFQGVRLDVTKQVQRGGASLKTFSIRASVVYGKAG